ncbi:C-type lectin domain family 4 member M-like isoform X2 [Dunckerocampus dactyliophorus]|uniref:C-type lectin domain family 4 member M-like isoform X2 n=1 Tax=Dunckerocampus dactyliophorus TaxID=161453 RepID=UPI0024051350|nr:C-type lectin domain family 4 member M-like isoform X2 [Dunckerocampus dactyliophorus]
MFANKLCSLARIGLWTQQYRHTHHTTTCNMQSKLDMAGKKPPKAFILPVATIRLTFVIGLIFMPLAEQVKGEDQTANQDGLKDMAELKKSIHGLDESIFSMGTTLLEHLKLLEGKAGNSQTQTGQVKEMTGESQNQTGQVKGMTGESQDLTGYMKKMVKEFQKMTGKVEEMTGQMKEQTGHMEAMIMESQKQTKKVEEMTGQMKEMTGKVADMTDESKKQTKKVEEMTGKVADMTDESKKQTRKVEEMTGKVEEMTGQVKKMTGQVVDMTVESKKQTRKVEEMTGKVEEMTGQVKKMTGKVVDMTAESKKQTRKVEEMTGQVKKMTGKVVDMTAESQKQTRKVEEMTGKVVEHSGQMKWITKDIVEDLLMKAGRCPLPWHYHDKRCYMFVNEKKTWNDAKSCCIDNGGHLASVHTKVKYDFLYELAGGRRTWFGGYKENNDWKWVDGSTFSLKKEGEGNSKDAKWAPGQPDNRGGSENCVDIFSAVGLNDLPCSVKQPFICQK